MGAHKPTALSLWAVILKIEASLQSDATLTCGIPYFFVFVRQF
jgi:hypothetical protein